MASADGSFANYRPACGKKWPTEEPTTIDPDTAIVIDIMALIHAYPLYGLLGSTYADFAVFVLRKIQRMAEYWKATRVDIVFDQYPLISIKCLEHARGALSRTPYVQRILNLEQKIPHKWKEFLNHGKNIEELAEFLSGQWSMSQVGFDLYIGQAVTAMRFS